MIEDDSKPVPYPNEYRRITSQGRIVIPTGFLDELGLVAGDHVKISLEDGSLVIRKAN